MDFKDFSLNIPFFVCYSLWMRNGHSAFCKVLFGSVLSRLRKVWSKPVVFSPLMTQIFTADTELWKITVRIYVWRFRENLRQNEGESAIFARWQVFGFVFSKAACQNGLFERKHSGDLRYCHKEIYSKTDFLNYFHGSSWSLALVSSTVKYASPNHNLYSDTRWLARIWSRVWKQPPGNKKAEG